MPKTKELSTKTQCMIITQHKMGKSYQEIARNLKIHRQIVATIVQKFRDNGIIENKKCIGRPKKTTTPEDRIIMKTSQRNSRLTALKLPSR